MVAVSARLLGKGGRFVFSTLHPAFNSTATRMVEQFENDDGVVRTYSVKVSSYIRPSAGRGGSLEGQPGVQWYFQRQICVLLRLGCAQGSVTDGAGEPVLPPGNVRPGSTVGVFVEVPPILVARMRLL